MCIRGGAIPWSTGLPTRGPAQRKPICKMCLFIKPWCKWYLLCNVNKKPTERSGLCFLPETCHRLTISGSRTPSVLTVVLRGAACHRETEVALEPLDQDEPEDRSHDGLLRQKDWTFLTLALGQTGFYFSLLGLWVTVGGTKPGGWSQKAELPAQHKLQLSLWPN